MFPCSYNALTIHKLSVCLPVTALTFTQVCSDRFNGLAGTIYRSQGSRLGSESHRSNGMDFGTFGVEWHIVMCTECGTFDNGWHIFIWHIWLGMCTITHVMGHIWRGWYIRRRKHILWGWHINGELHNILQRLWHIFMQNLTRMA